MEELLGEYYENYEEVSSIEESNYGQIFRGFNKITKKNVCLKITNKKKMLSSDYDFLKECLEREEIITKLCNSDYTVNFYQKIETENAIIFELEDCEDNLKDYLYNSGELNKEIKFFKQIILQVAKALKIIYNNGVIHRDIKPHNIFIKANQKERIIKLGDFGSSIFKKDNKSDPIGTILYTAPEIIKNLKYDEKCDLWSLGVTLFELYFGIFPFGPNTTPTSIKKAIYDDEKNFIFLKSGIPTLDILLKRLLVINPEERMTFEEFFEFVFNKDFMENDDSFLNQNPKYKNIYENILKEPKINYNYDNYVQEGANQEKMQKMCVDKILNFVEGDHLPDIMSFPNGSTKDLKYNNIIYYDENTEHLTSIKKDCVYFEQKTLGAFILCINFDSFRLVRQEILRERKKDKRITFNLITTGSKCVEVMEFLKEIKDFDDCITNVCIYCFHPEKYLHLKFAYERIHDDIYKNKDDVGKFIEMFSAKEIKPFPMTKLIRLQEYKDTYHERHFKISQFYGNLTKEDYDKYYEEMKNIIIQKSESNELRKNQTILFKAFLSFNLEEDIKELDKLIIKEYTKNTFHGDLNKWLMNSTMNIYEPIAYFTSRLMWSLNNYAITNNMYCNQNDKIFYRGVKLSYTNILPYQRAEGKIILLSAFTSTSEDEIRSRRFSGRDNAQELFNTNLKFSVLFRIKHKYKDGWISSGINIQNESQFKNEKEYLFQPFTFYHVNKVNINIKEYTADIYLETIGKLEILEKKIKYNHKIDYNENEDIMQVID